MEDLLEGGCGLLHRRPEAVHQRARRLRVAGEEAEAGEGLAGELGLEAVGEAVEDRLDGGAGGEAEQALAEAGEVPVQRLGLAGEAVEAGLVEVGGGEGRVEAVEEAPGAVVEALAGDRDVVGVEHAVHEAGGEPLGAEPGDGADHAVVEAGDRVGRRGGVGPVVGDGVVDQPAERVGLAEGGEALEAADADVAVAEADQHRGAGGRGLVAARERLAGLDEREGLRGVDAERLEHLGGEDLAHAALQRQPPVAAARPAGGPEPLVPRSRSRPSARSRAWAKRKPRPSPMSGL